jgi:hypothetical protein
LKPSPGRGAGSPPEAGLYAAVRSGPQALAPVALLRAVASLFASVHSSV